MEKSQMAKRILVFLLIGFCSAVGCKQSGPMMKIGVSGEAGEPLEVGVKTNGALSIKTEDALEVKINAEDGLAIKADEPLNINLQADEPLAIMANEPLPVKLDIEGQVLPIGIVITKEMLIVAGVVGAAVVIITIMVCCAAIAVVRSCRDVRKEIMSLKKSDK